MKTEPIDDLLKNYFRAEMPKPWPKFAPPETTPARKAMLAGSTASLTMARWVVAVAVVLFFGMYMGLASFFPRTQFTNPDLDAVIGGPGIANQGKNPGTIRPKKVELIPIPMK